jgi:hypothetical protein
MSITMASVYDGRELVGHVLHHIDERIYEAVGLENKSCGMYATHREAAAALPASSSTPASATPEPKSLT